MNSAVEYADIELFQLFKAGNMDAFEVIYKKYHADLIREAFRVCGSRAESKDMVQDIFVSLFQKVDHIEIKFSLRAYLFQTLKYKILNNKRDNLIHNSCHNEIFRNSICENGFPNELEVKEFSASLYRAIAALPKKCKQVFLLSREGEYSHKLISSHLNISTSTVEKHIGKALRILREKLHVCEEFA